MKMGLIGDSVGFIGRRIDKGGKRRDEILLAGKACVGLIRNKKCRDPGSNQGPSDLQSDALPTELSRRFNHHSHSMPNVPHGAQICWESALLDAPGHDTRPVESPLIIQSILSVKKIPSSLSVTVSTKFLKRLTCSHRRWACFFHPCREDRDKILSRVAICSTVLLRRSAGTSGDRKEWPDGFKSH